MTKKDYLLISRTISDTWKKKYPHASLPPTEVRRFLASLTSRMVLEFKRDNENFDGEEFINKIWEAD